MNQVYCCVLAQPWIWSIFFLWNNQFEYRHADIVVNVEVSLSEKDPFYRAFCFFAPRQNQRHLKRMWTSRFFMASS